MNKKNIKKWAVIVIFITTILLTIELFYALGHLAKDYDTKDRISVLHDSLFLIIFTFVAVVSGITVLSKKSIVAIKLHCACLILLVVFYVYSFMDNILNLIPKDSTIFFIAGWIPILLGIGAYFFIIKSMLENETGSDNFSNQQKD